MTLTVLSPTAEPFCADCAARWAPSAASWQFMAISAEVADISSPAVAKVAVYQLFLRQRRQSALQWNGADGRKQQHSQMCKISVL
jgi:hypothetical protein